MNIKNNALEAYSDKEREELQNTYNKVENNVNNIMPYIELYDILNRISEVLSILKHKNIFKVSTGDLINFQGMILLKALEASKVYKNATHTIHSTALFEKNKQLILDIAKQHNIHLDRDSVIRNMVQANINREYTDIDPEQTPVEKPLSIKSAHMTDYISNGEKWVTLEQPKNDPSVVYKKEIVKSDKLADKLKNLVKKGVDKYVDFIDQYVLDKFKIPSSKLAQYGKKTVKYESIVYKGIVYEAIDPANVEIYIFAVISQIEHINITNSTASEIDILNKTLKNQLAELEAL